LRTQIRKIRSHKENPVVASAEKIQEGGGHAFSQVSAFLGGQGPGDGKTVSKGRQALGGRYRHEDVRWGGKPTKVPEHAQGEAKELFVKITGGLISHMLGQPRFDPTRFGVAREENESVSVHQ
jgi:hypothetical protein